MQLSDETFLPRVQETLHIERAFVAFGFLKVIELMSHEGDSRNVSILWSPKIWLLSWIMVLGEKYVGGLQAESVSSFPAASAWGLHLIN